MKKKSSIIITTFLFIVIIVGVCFLFKPLFGGLKFGLDLQGGFEILYKAESIDGSKMNHSKLMATYKTLSKSNIGLSFIVFSTSFISESFNERAAVLC